jgi:hypothetical protein
MRLDWDTVLMLRARHEKPVDMNERRMQFSRFTHFTYL